MQQELIFDGPTYDASQDAARLGNQLEAVKNLMSDGRWRTLDEIGAECGCRDASASARLRDLRKPRFGGMTVERRSRGERQRGLYEYRVVV